jgi:hypothetical protein
LAGLAVATLTAIGVSVAQAQQSIDNRPMQNDAPTGFSGPASRETPSCQGIEFTGWLQQPADAQPRCLSVQYEEALPTPAAPEANGSLNAATTPGTGNVIPANVIPDNLLPKSPYSWNVDVLARGFYRNDQRIAWTGVEETYAAEGVIAGQLRRKCNDWDVTLNGEFYINQPFDQNIITTSQEQVSYLGNYKVDTFEVSQLSISCRRDDFTVTLGKIVTPFGRYYFPLYTNSRIDAPFIRTEAILWRETGLLLHYQPGIFVGDVAMTNGSEDLDTNSSKALVSRIGLQQENWAVGLSVKCQDGVGSETQKEFKNHVGADAMVRSGRFQLSGEFIYDEYGFRHPWFKADDIYWQHSIYYRDLNLRDGVPLTGVGYYVNLGYNGERWDVNLNYGDYFPVAMGNPQHDEPNHRGVAKCLFHYTRNLGLYGCVLVENGGWAAQLGELRQGWMVLGGLQYTF